MSKMSYLVLLLSLFALFAVVGCEAKSGAGNGQDTDSNSDTDTDSDTSACDEEGAYDCINGDYYECVDGSWTLVEECEHECYPAMGCLFCIPGETYCEGTVVMQCDLDGESSTPVIDCADYGVECAGGECDFSDPCVAALAYKSNIGCEYWAADLDNSENIIDDAAAGQFAVAVANIGSNGAAHVEVHINNAAQGEPLDLELIDEANIDEGDLKVALLPRRDVDGENITDNVDDGPQSWLSSRAFRITSDVPVVAYQFNTLDQQFSNDASLLLPTSGLDEDHVILGYPPHSPLSTPMSPKTRGYITILGTVENTEVTVTTTAAVQAGVGVDEIPEGGTDTFTIGPFDVLNLETKLYTIIEMMGDPSVDFSGSRVIADQPVAVFFGTDMSMVGQDEVYPDSCCAEHIEQQVLPSVAMGQRFVVSHSAQRNSSTPEMDYYRIMAYETATVATSLSPPNDSFTLAEGQYRDFFVNTGFTVETEDGYLHVAQFLVDAGNTSAGIGDTALLYVPAVEQRRGVYVFTTGQGFSSNYAVISAPENTPMKIDDLDVETTCDGPLIDGELEGLTYESWTCEIADGAHMVHSGDSPDEADYPIGVLVYGYYYAGSYAYPAGSDLREINPVDVE
jgi:hypothetical protein